MYVFSIFFKSSLVVHINEHVPQQGMELQEKETQKD